MPTPTKRSLSLDLSLELIGTAVTPQALAEINRLGQVAATSTEKTKVADHMAAMLDAATADNDQEAVSAIEPLLQVLRTRIAVVSVREAAELLRASPLGSRSAARKAFNEAHARATTALRDLPAGPLRSNLVMELFQSTPADM